MALLHLISRRSQMPLFRALFVSLMSLALATMAWGQDLDEINPFNEPPGLADGFGDPAAEAGAGAENELSAEERAAAQQKQALEDYAKATELFDAGKFDEAIPLFSKLLGMVQQGGEESVALYLLRGQALSEIGEKQLALGSLGLAVSYASRVPQYYGPALAERGKVNMDVGLPEDAKGDFDGAVETAPSNPEYLFLRGKALNRLARSSSGQFSGPSSGDLAQQAISSLTRAVTVKPDYAEAFAERGTAYAMAREFESAVADFERAVQIEGDSAQYRAQFGFMLLQRAALERIRPNGDKNQIAQDYQSAIDAFSKYLDMEGNRPKAEFRDEPADVLRPGQVYTGRAAARSALARETKDSSLHRLAADDLNAALEYDQNDLNAMLQLGITQRLMGDLDAAADTFTDALDLNPGLVEANLRRGICYYYQGDNESAKRDFERAIAFSTTRDGRAEFWLGVAHAKEGDFEIAVRNYSRAIRLNPRYKPAYSNRGLALMKLKQYRRAAGDFDELLRRNRKDTVARQRRDMARQLMTTQRR